MQKPNLIKVSKAKDLLFKPSTLYRWHHTKTHPEIFLKFGGSLFVDADLLAQIIEATRGQAGAGGENGAVQSLRG